MLVRFVIEEGLANMYGIVCSTCILGSGLMGNLRAPSVPSYVSVYIFVALNACVCSNFLYSNLMREACDNVNYGAYKKFVWVVVLGGWSLDMVVYEVYTIEAISKYVYVVGGILCVC